MKPETKRLLLDVELEMAKERLVFKKQQIERYKYGLWHTEKTRDSKEEEMEEELQPFIENYEQKLDAVNQSMEKYPNKL